MQEPYWWYVLYVRTNTEQKVVEYFNQVFIKKNLPYELEAFCLESEKYYNNKKYRPIGKNYIKRPLFANYVFVETNMPASEFRCAIADMVFNSSDIIKLLTNGESGEIAITAEERMRLEYLMKGKRCLEHSIGFIEGEKITITGGALIGMEGSITKINRHHRTAKIEIAIFSRKQIVEVALEIMEKK